MIVADGLTAFLSGHAYKAMTRALTAHFSTGEFAFNAYTPLVMRLANYSPTLKALHARTAGEGINDPREPESWGARLTLIEELLLVRAPEVAKFPQPLRVFTRLCAHSTMCSSVLIQSQSTRADSCRRLSVISTKCRFRSTQSRAGGICRLWPGSIQRACGFGWPLARSDSCIQQFGNLTLNASDWA
jgi:hypothetical protein